MESNEMLKDETMIDVSDEGINYFETFNSFMKLSDNIFKIPTMYNRVIGFYESTSNSFRHRKEHNMIVDRIDYESNQQMSPIQFDIAHDFVEIKFNMTDESLENDHANVSDELEQINMQRWLMGDKLFVDKLYEKMGVSGFEDMGDFVDDPAYEIHDDGYTYTNDKYTYSVKHSTRSISSQLIEFEGLSASPQFVNKPKGYKDKYMNEFFDVDLETIRGNHQLSGSPYDENMSEVLHFVEDLKQGLRNGNVDPESVDFGINTYPKIYDLNDMENPRLTFYQILGEDESLNAFFDDLDLIANDPNSLNSGSVTGLDVVHTALNYIGRHKLRDGNYTMKDLTKSEIEKQPTYNDLVKGDLVIDGVVELSHGDGTFASYVESGGFQDDKGNDYGGVFELEGMFSTKEQLASKNRSEMRKEMTQNKEIQNNRKNHKVLTEKYDAKLTRMMEPESNRDEQLDLDHNSELEL